MGNYFLLSLSLGFLLLSHACFAQLWPEQQSQSQWQALRGQGQHRLRGKTDCRIERLTAQQPNRVIKSEAGTTEMWDQNDDQLQCAGVSLRRLTIQPRGLLLPSYANTPQIYYIIRGRAVQGAVIPGCPRTYESLSQSRGQQQVLDRHQKVRRLREGDVVAHPAGVADWLFNDGDVPLVIFALDDVGNQANQLDFNRRKFSLAGVLLQGQEQEQQQQIRERGQEQGQGRGRGQEQEQEQGQGRGQEQEQGQGRGQEQEQGQGRGRGQEQGQGRGQEQEQGQGRGREQGQGRGQGQQVRSRNIFSAFDRQFLANLLNIRPEIAQKLQGENDQRGSIVRVGDEFEVLSPEFQGEEQEREQERERERDVNSAITHPFCSLRLRENIEKPSRADVYTPRGGRVSSLNSHNLPILNWLQLSAERGVLYKNAILAPHWNINAHSIVYILRGSGRIQIVGNAGRSVFNDRVQEGQVIVVPQNFAVVKKASEEGLEWISFKTNDNAMVSPLVGRASVLRSIPRDVLASSYDISRDDASSLKFNRQELGVFGPGSQRGEEA